MIPNPLTPVRAVLRRVFPGRHLTAAELSALHALAAEVGTPGPHVRDRVLADVQTHLKQGDRT